MTKERDGDSQKDGGIEGKTIAETLERPGKGMNR